MDPSTWTPKRALVFARGLYHVAACDGIDAEEAATIRRFLDAVDLKVDFDTLASEPFDYHHAAQTLDSPWLRRTFIDACLRMTRVDGRITDEERDAMRAMSAALKIGERKVIESLNRPVCAEAEQDLVAWMAGRPVDLISWDDDAQPGLFWTFPHGSHPIAEGAELVVETGQAAIVHHEGEICDVLSSGQYRFAPPFLPRLSAKTGWAGGPVCAQITFASIVSSPRWRWGTADPVRVDSERLGTFPLRSFGRFCVRVSDPGDAYLRFGNLQIGTYQARARRIVAGRFGQAIQRLVDAGEPLSELLADLDQLAERVLPHLQETLGRSGLTLHRFFVDHVTTPLELGLPSPHRPTTQLRITTAGDLSGKQTATLRPCMGCMRPMPAGAKFCAHCGASLRRRCTCGHEMHRGARFCAECGQAQG